MWILMVKLRHSTPWPLLNECGSNSGTLGSPFAFGLKCTSAHHKVEQTPLLPDPKSCSQPWTVSTLHPLDALLLLLTPSPSPVPIWIHKCYHLIWIKSSHVSFCLWLLPPSTMVSKSIFVVVNINTSSLPWLSMNRITLYEQFYAYITFGFAI